MSPVLLELVTSVMKPFGAMTGPLKRLCNSHVAIILFLPIQRYDLGLEEGHLHHHLIMPSRMQPRQPEQVIRWSNFGNLPIRTDTLIICEFVFIFLLDILVLLLLKIGGCTIMVMDLGAGNIRTI